MSRQKNSILTNEHALNREPVSLKVRLNWETFAGGTRTLVHHGFSWYISLLYLHDCEMKFPNSNLYIELKPIPDDFFLSLLKLVQRVTYLISRMTGARSRQIQRAQIHFIPREARRGQPSREVYNLVARSLLYHTSIARPVWFPLG